MITNSLTYTAPESHAVSAALKRLVHSIVPRSLVNLAWNLAGDLKELPARVRDPRPRPWRFWHNVGGGDFHNTGDAFFALFRTEVALEPESHVLDLGCGAGRLAFPICAFLSANGRYTGFDIAPRAIRFARRHVRGACSIEFVLADLANHEYQRSGASAASYTFPAEDGSVDAALATSLFSHLMADDAKAYLQESGRVLRPGGRLMLTGFLVGPGDREKLGARECRLALQPFGEDAYVADPRHPERAIGFDETAFMSWAAQAGLKLSGDYARGDWRAPSATGGEFQDRLVLERI